MFSLPQLDESHSEPIYRQLYEHIRAEILSGRLARGERIPPTRELAAQLELNRTTIAASYELLEKEGLIRAHVGRGSFVEGPGGSTAEPGTDGFWMNRLFHEPSSELPLPPLPPGCINFTSARPAGDLFPLDIFRTLCAEVISGPEAAGILQLGSAYGYPPLRQRLLDDARAASEARDSDDVMVTNGCQQGLDLLQRLLAGQGESVAIEDPVYAGMRNVFQHGGAKVHGIRVAASGIDLDELERLTRRERLAVVAVTPNFHNPTGATMPLEARLRLLDLARDARLVIVENDVYGELRYEGEPLPSLKSLDSSGLVVQLRSFSKVAFPGLRVGWVTAPRPLIAALAARKLATDLHSDQLSQAVLHRFLESGRLAEHVRRIVTSGRARAAAAVGACAALLPDATKFTRPEGGMNLWVSLPEPVDASALLERAIAAGVAYLPARYFAVSRAEPGGLRLSFAHLSEDRIREGIARLASAVAGELDRARSVWRDAGTPAIV